LSLTPSGELARVHAVTREEALHELGLDADATTAERRAAFFALLQKRNALGDLAAFGRLYAAHQRLERDGPQADAKPAPATESDKPGWAQWFDKNRPATSWKFWFGMLAVGGFLAMRGRRDEPPPPAPYVASTPASPQEAQRSIDSVLELARTRQMPAFVTELTELRAALSGTSCEDAQKKLAVAIETFGNAPLDVRNSQSLSMERVRGGVDSLCRGLEKPAAPAPSASATNN
jgi:hypothetical protein